MRGIAVFLLSSLGFAPLASACGGAPVCTVVDPTGTPLNVREGPNGRVLSVLREGAKVEVIEHRDEKGSRWALVARYGEASGWVFGAYLACEGEDDYGRICSVKDPTGTPLNIHEAPNGAILGTWDNGVRVRPYGEQKLDGKLWYAVERIADDNVAGWVFDPYLRCEEDGETH